LNYPSFDNIIERLNEGKLFSFHGGVHPDEKKQLSNKTIIKQPSLPESIIVPLRQHVGSEGVCCVNVGDYVLKGQPLTTTTTPYAVPVHASTSGTIVSIAPHVVAHPSGLTEMCICIKPDGKDSWIDLKPLSNYGNQDKSTIVNAICQAGISGMGGAGFPTHIKAASSKPVEFLIINGVECEPYITADDRLMREHAWQIRQGLDVLTHLIGPQAIIIAIEDNKPEALEALNIACQDKEAYRVVSLETKYPSGGEKQLIQVLTGREVPRNGLPADIGIMMFNVGTCFAIADAILHGKPLIERIVTVTGDAVDLPTNFRALLGTPVAHLLSEAGYHANKQDSPKVIMGGPMMGFALADATIPVVKTTNCLLVPGKHELTADNAERPCIRCSACAEACPASLLPQQLFWHAKAKEYDKAEEYDLFDCIECGACAYVCPSEIPLVHYYRQAKSEIRLQRDEKNKAEKARQRFEARNERLEQEKREREEKHRRAKEARLAAGKNMANKSDAAPPSETKDKVAAALARAKAKKANLQQRQTEESVTPADDKKAQVAAAIARAKAKKAAQSQPSANVQARAEDKPDALEKPLEQQLEKEILAAQDDKKARVAAAVARAKAKKALAQQNAVAPENASQLQDHPRGNSESPLSTSEDITSAESDTKEENQTSNEKQKRIAAAVAKAKAQKAQRDNRTQNARTAPLNSDVQEDAITPVASTTAPVANNSVNSNASARTNDVPTPDKAPSEAADAEKKVRIAAAVAKAKAKKRLEKDNSKAPQSDVPVISAPIENEPSSPDQTDEADIAKSEKKRRVAQAVAKAKAKKAEAKRENNQS